MHAYSSNRRESRKHLQLFFLPPPLIGWLEPEWVVSQTVIQLGSVLLNERCRQLWCMLLLRGFHITFLKSANSDQWDRFLLTLAPGR